MNEDGICKTCEATLELEVGERTRIMNDCIRIIRDSKNKEVRLKRCDLAIEHAAELYEYEKMGLVAPNISFGEVIQKLQKQKTDIEAGL